MSRLLLSTLILVVGVSRAGAIEFGPDECAASWDAFAEAEGISLTPKAVGDLGVRPEEARWLMAMPKYAGYASVGSEELMDIDVETLEWFRDVVIVAECYWPSEPVMVGEGDDLLRVADEVFTTEKRLAVIEWLEEHR